MSHQDDPYQLPAGPELHPIIHLEVLKRDEAKHYLPYSTDDAEAKKVLKYFKANYTRSLTTGSTIIRGKDGFVG
ncbi:MAG: hypothetical protein M2R45_01458 [Verrucomicrobia subdivision 3 bacterium]|nr:hypothetical protein [Limisphaerales bacterium]MCS1413412.1 hypothetical protein [Limisphaerales bacterium]